MKEYKIYNDRAPRKWIESLPIGSGRMGATLMCGVAREVIHLNEETIWSSQEGAKADPKMPEKLRKIRQLFLDDKPAMAEKLAGEIMGDCQNDICSYETAGKLSISFHGNEYCTNYHHELDIMRGIAVVEYDRMGSHYKREYFASYPDDVIVCRFTSSKKPLNAWITYDRECTDVVNAENNELCAIGHTMRGNHKFCVKVRIVTDGKVECSDREIFVSDTQSFCAYISVKTEFRYGDSFINTEYFPGKLDFEALKEKHQADVLSLMSRADISLPSVSELKGSSTYYRLKAMIYDGVRDGDLAALIWQFGRYLTVASSRPGTLPANLQGLWTEDNNPPWCCDYHLNINLQMNYWPAEVANLSECHLPLFEYMNEYLLESGKNTARIAYGTRGCVAHHISDIYGFTLPYNALWGLWPHGASWLSFHMWEHYLFTEDENFLREAAYEFIRESAIFFLENLVEDKKGRMVYAPSTSPENRYFAKDENGEEFSCFLAMSSTMDVEIIGGLFRILIEASEILGIADDDIKKIKAAKEKLPALSVGKHGQLMEWIEDYDEVEIGHRHISHAFALYPDCAINRSTPELYNALDKTVDRRLLHGDSGWGVCNIGWSLTWLMAIFARLHRGNDAYSMLNNYMMHCTSQNLFNAMPEYGEKVFQIEANCAFTAALSEMLLQSHEGFISIIPTLPKEWNEGSFRGLRARGEFEIDAVWENYEVCEICVSAEKIKEVTIELPSTQKNMRFYDDNGKTYEAKDNKLSIDVDKKIHLCLSDKISQS